MIDIEYLISKSDGKTVILSEEIPEGIIICNPNTAKGEFVWLRECPKTGGKYVKLPNGTNHYFMA